MIPPDNNSYPDLSQPLETLFGPSFMPFVGLQSARSLGGASTAVNNTLSAALPSDSEDAEHRVAEAPVDSKKSTAPIEVLIITTDYEIRGLIYVSRVAREERRISDLINDRRRRFLAVTDAQVSVRTAPSSPRRYSFLQLHLDNILMIHPSTQSLVRQSAVADPEEVGRFDALRDKLTHIGRILP